MKKYFLKYVSCLMALISLPINAEVVDVQTLLNRYSNESVGAVVGYIDQGQIHYFQFGRKSLEGEEPMGEDTIFEMGSITKVFTSLLLMDRVQRGEMELDDPIEKYLPGVKIPEFEGKKITLRHLATHHSGLPCLPDNFNPKDLLNPYEDYTVQDMYDFLSSYTLQRMPGESFEYSNLAVGLLGHILCKKSGLSYEELVRERICGKLPMNHTGIELKGEDPSHFAKGYHQREEVPYWDIPTLAGAGALRSTIKDMTQFLSASMGLLDSPLTDLMKKCQQPQFSIPDAGIDVGLGWLIFHSSEANILCHNGGTGGFRTFLGFNPEQHRGIVVLSNSTEEWPDHFALHVLDPKTYRLP